MANFPGKPFFNSALAATVVDIKAPAGGGHVISLEAMNVDPADVFVQMWNKDAADVTIGTTAPDYCIHVPPGDATLFGSAVRSWPDGLVFDVGLSWAATTTPTGLTAGTTGLDISIGLS